MVNRWIGIASLGIMMSVNAALLVRDVLPDWLAGDPPVSRALQLSPGEEVSVQIGIFDGEDRRVGYSWTRSNRSDDLVTIRHQTVLHSRALPGNVKLPSIRIDTHLSYYRQSILHDLRIQVHGFDIPIRLEGEFFEPDEFPCEWQVGARRGHFVLPAETTRALGDVFRPFESLPGLIVGQSWRVKLLNPLAGIVPDWGARNMMADSMLVRVKRLETIEHHGATVTAFVLAAEEHQLRAWVTPEGRVIRQQIELPLFGTLILLDEPYDAATRRRVLLEALTD